MNVCANVILDIFKGSMFRLTFISILRMPTQQQLYTINWAGMRMARDRVTPALLTFVNKQCVDWLPTGQHMQRRGNLVTLCKRCGGEENRDHLLLCENQTDIHATVLTSFREFLGEIKTDPKCTNVLIKHLSAWIKQVPYPEVDDTDPYDRAAAAQHMIGWNLFSRGFVVNHWAELQESFAIKYEHKTMGDAWSARVTGWWFTTVHKIWLDRNSDLYQPEDNEMTRQQEEILAQVQELYKSENDLSHHDRHIFDIPVETRIKQHWRTLKAWVDLTTVTVRTCINAYHERMRIGQRDIRDFFTIRRQARSQTADMSSNNRHRQNRNNSAETSSNTYIERRLRQSTLTQNCETSTLPPVVNLPSGSELPVGSLG
jgi:hypothetical protein